MLGPRTQGDQQTTGVLGHELWQRGGQRLPLLPRSARKPPRNLRLYAPYKGIKGI